MSNLSGSSRTALSYLKDVERAKDQLHRIDNYITREDEGYELMRGDLQLARRQASYLRGQERANLEAQCCFQQGSIYWAMADGQTPYLSLPDGKARYRELISKAAESFQLALNHDPEPLYHYCLGLMCVKLGRKTEALQHLQIVVSIGAPDLVSNAHTEIARLGLMGASASLAPGTNGGMSVGSIDFVSRKEPDWSEITKGGIALVIGIFTAGFLIGIPIALWGIYVIAKGFIYKVTA